MELANDADLRTTAPKEKKEPAPRVLAAVADDRLPPPGSMITRTYKGEELHVKVLIDGFEWDGEVFPIAVRGGQGDHRLALQRLSVLRPDQARCEMTRRNGKPRATQPGNRCAIYTRKSTEEGLEQEFNTLDAQRESGEAMIKSQQHEGWTCLPQHYDDGGFTGGNMDRPALKRLLADIQAGKIDCVVVYKVDRLSRSLLDFARILEIFETHGVAFVSVTQQFNTATSMGRLMLNVLLVLRPVRTGDDQRADPRQDRRHPPQGEMVGRDAGAGLQRRRYETGGRQGRGRAGAADLQVVPGTWARSCRS